MGDGQRDARKLIEKLGFPSFSRRRRPFDDGTGLPVDWDAPETRREVRPIGVALSEMAGKMGAAAAAGDGSETAPAEEIVEAWNRILDDDLKGRLSIEKYVGGMLYVVARNSTEMFEIRRTRVRGLEAKARRMAPFARLRQIRVMIR